MMKTLRCGVVGLGRIAWDFHLPEICRQEGFELAAIVDPNEERLREAGERFGVKNRFTSLSQMLGSVKPDLTVIASPTIFHAAQAIEALRSGSCVFCDKPLALNQPEAARMFRAAQECGRKLMPYQPHRTSGECAAARRILGSGKLGEIYLIERHISHFSRRNDWQAFLRNGGGMLQNYGSHYIDQLLYLLNDRAERVKCELRRIVSLGDADDVVKIVISTRRDILLDISINQAAALELPRWRICGNRGAAVREADGSWRLRYFPPDALPETGADRTLAAAGRRYPREEIPWREEVVEPAAEVPGEYYRHCYDFFALDQPPLVPPEEAVELLRILDDCRRDAETSAAPVCNV